MRIRLNLEGLVVVLTDSIALVEASDKGAVIVTGSHGGASAVTFARSVAAMLYVFNDAGVGKDGAGIAALALLDALDQPAIAVSHDSARIGDARDAWEHGIVSHVNEHAAALMCTVGGQLKQQLDTLRHAL